MIKNINLEDPYIWGTRPNLYNVRLYELMEIFKLTIFYSCFTINNKNMLPFTLFPSELMNCIVLSLRKLRNILAVLPWIIHTRKCSTVHCMQNKRFIFWCILFHTISFSNIIYVSKNCEKWHHILRLQLIKVQLTGRLILEKGNWQ